MLLAPLSILLSSPSRTSYITQSARRMHARYSIERARHALLSDARRVAYRAQDMRALPPSPRALVVVLFQDDEENDALREEAPAHEARRECGGQG